MRVLLATLAILLVGTVATFAADGYWTMGTNSPLWGHGSGWQFYNASDAPEGAWRNITAGDGNPPPMGNLTNTFTLPAGTNYFLAKIIAYNDTTGIGFVVGGNSNWVALNNGDWNKYWTVPIPVVVAAPTNVYHIQITATSYALGQTKAIVRGLYVTTNATENVYAENNTGYDYILDYTYNGTILSATPSGNLLEDGGFDTGIGHGWGIWPNSGIRDASIASMWDTNVYHDGSGSIHIPVDLIMARSSFNLAQYQVALESKPFKLRPNRQHTISVWTKGTSTDTGILKINNPITVPTGLGYSNATIATATITADANWHRTTLTTNLVAFPTDDFQISITVPTNTWIDSVQIEEGALTDFAPKPLSIGCFSGRTGNLFSSDEPVVLPINLYSTTNGTATFSYQVYDWLNQNVISNVVSKAVTANALVTTNLTLAVGRTGSFRMLLNVIGSDIVEEVLFNVLPLFTQTNLFVGTHAAPANYQIQPLYKAGIRTTRAMSAGQMFNWSKTEPTDDDFRYFDGDVAKFYTNGISIVGTLYEFPSWTSLTVQTNDPSAWKQYVTNVVTHYAASVDQWEIWNEPLYVMSQVAYTNLFITAAQAIRALDPTAKIVFLGGVHDDAWSRTALDYMSPTYTNLIDIVSTHMYPTDVDPSGGDTANKAYKYSTNVGAAYPSFPVWNTEAGIFCLGDAVYNANFMLTGDPLWPHLETERFQNGAHYFPELSLKNALDCFGWGEQRYYYYDSRVVGAHPSYFKTHTSSWDYDDSIKPKMALLSVLNYLIGDAVGIGKITNSTMVCYEFAQGNNTWLAIWSSNQLAKSITIGTNMLSVFDAMGNTVTTVTNGNNQSFAFARKPVYVKAVGVATNVLQTLAQAATVSNISDTNAPKLSIDVGPRVASASSAFFRWVAYDDVDVPSEATPNALLYSSKLDSGAWSSWDAGTTITVTLQPTSTAFYVAAKDSTGNAATNAIYFSRNGSSVTGTAIRSPVQFKGRAKFK